MTHRRRLSLHYTVLFCLMVGIALSCYIFGRSLWHTIMVKINGGSTIADRISTIVERHPQLAKRAIKHVTIVAIKDPGYVDIFIDGEKWQRFPFTAQSGTSGPKLREGDGQIPEGLYNIVALNPNSSYHLSMKISYPNSADIKRSQALGISDYGSDIYIHGKNASIGCIAIGDDAIEQVFYVVHKVGYKNVNVAIAPVDLLHANLTTIPADVVYDHIKKFMARYYK